LTGAVDVSDAAAQLRGCAALPPHSGLVNGVDRIGLLVGVAVRLQVHWLVVLYFVVAPTLSAHNASAVGGPSLRAQLSPSRAFSTIEQGRYAVSA
jgi:hypothetical protein